MSLSQPKTLTVDGYIDQFPADIQEILQRIRKMIREAVPQATEKIAYGMPGFYLNGPLAYFAAFKHHIGFYPIPSGIAAFQDELAGYKTSKGGVQFPLNQPVPYDLIVRIVRFRAAELAEKKK
jgi:uncharacterized protein YdhG (YjbR/CyaY superfamily)